MYKDAHGTKKMQLKLSRHLFYCDGVKGGFEKDRNIGDGVSGKKMFKQKTRERKWKDQQKPREDEQKPLKQSLLNSSCESEEKSLYKK